MAEKRFSELTTAGAMTGAELLAMSQETLGTLLSVKSTLQNIANWFAVNSQYASALDTTDKTLCGAINELRQLISLIPQFSIEVVQTLPTEDISETTIYLVPSSDPEQGNYYEEYIYVNNTWELVGTTAVDLSAYYTKLEVDGLLAAKANTSDVTAALALKEAKADLDDDVTDIVVGLTDEQTTAPGNPVTLTTAQSGGAKSALVTFVPKQSGTGDPSPTNIRPISGWDSLDLIRTGKNLINALPAFQFLKQNYYGNNLVIDETAKTAVFNSTGAGYYGLIQKSSPKFPTYYNFKENTSYTFIFKSDSTSDFLNIAVSFTDGTNTGSFRKSNRDADGYITYVSPSNKTVSSLYIGQYSGNTTFYYETFCVMEGTHTRADFEPYSGETYTATFPDTIIGGSYDFVSGKLTITEKRINLGNLTWSDKSARYSKYRYRATIPDEDMVVITDPGVLLDGLVCEIYKETTGNQNYQNVQGICGTDGKYLWVYDDRYADESDESSLTTALSGVYACYPLATPQEITLTPEQIELLKGSNTIWTDGDTVQIKYSELPNGNLGAVIDYIKKLEARVKALES